ncbi:uncharacterized protein AMSG_00365 [Thecamonas trahens ATCC 50062]|uniref:RWD domain-containing protein n=1 Tax=Thecamonas trahens ATCC 50062 TaxID=461836 RepID=A0A0L0DBD2_THETB|nr:hypothetical protein AMSG_00365 [Thecamonas trahens ATCC 50062]KNC48588.1 hypothetical protein AMSG_00365 [Thecamonas trahens ATCC 50062]|eukprot:XP_013762644.1 hypothetical protein AMSG_00365 [Thecamonas trahens ATCC 50062]
MAADLLEECLEMQQDEVEALEAIYSEAFACISTEPYVVQVTVQPPRLSDDDDGDNEGSGDGQDEADDDGKAGYRPIVLEFTFVPEYPLEAGVVASVDVFANEGILSDEAREALGELMEATAAEADGAAAVYDVVEAVREAFRDLIPPVDPSVGRDTGGGSDGEPDGGDDGASACKRGSNKTAKMTKKEKKRALKGMDFIAGERPRGHDWVDIISHLART